MANHLRPVPVDSAPLLAAALALAVHFQFGSDVRAQDPVEVELVPWATLDRPLAVDACGDGRLYVARQSGRVSIITDSMTVMPVPFLDISGVTVTSGERGLLGFAFDPDHASNGFFYVNYVRDSGFFGASRISRFTRSAANPDVADPASETVLIELLQPDPIHQAGGLAFGPDGYLYCALGDGGGSGDPDDQGQDRATLFGKVLRIKPEPDSTYSIPPDNPFVGAMDGSRAEIWAYGLRNPFRISLDPENGDLWIGDVGQQLWEEIDRWPGGDNSGPNFGWRCYEGDAPFLLDGCQPVDQLVFPVVTQAHSVNGGSFCAVIGGVVYRGALWPRFQGRYFYTDYCLGGIRTLTPDGMGGYVDQLAATATQFGNSSFFQDADGQFYLTNTSNNTVYKVKDRCPMDAPIISPDGNLLHSTPASAYQWYLNGEALFGETAQDILASEPGAYTVQVTYSNGCIKLSGTYVHLSTFQEEAVIGPRVHWDGDSRELILLDPPCGRSGCAVEVLDAQGRSISTSRALLGRAQRISLPDLTAGQYMVLVRSDLEVRRARFVVSR